MASKNASKAARSVVGRLPATIEVGDLTLLNEALAYLFHELDKATELHQSDAKAGREGVIHSVETVVHFLSVFAPVISSRLHAPLGVLYDALMNLDDGKVLPLLKPAKRTGRTRASALRASLIGAAVFTVKRLTETRMEARNAHKAVANTLKGLGVKPARGSAGTITARTIRGWCEEVSADVGQHGEAAQAYYYLMNDPKGSDINELPPTEARDVLFNRLAAVVRTIRAHEGA
jgi:hypothetical protein